MVTKKVLIITRNSSFLQPILNELSLRDCTVRQHQFTNNDCFNMITLHESMVWADYAFFDFCYEPLPMASFFNFNCRVTARLHGLEVYGPAKTVNWKNINLVCSAPQHARFIQEITGIPASITIAGIGVNIEPTEKPKEIFGHNIGLTAVTPLPRKRIYTTIESFCDLLTQSKYLGLSEQWFLHVRGGLTTTGYRDSEAQEYLNFLHEFKVTLKQLGYPIEQIIFHDWMDPNSYQQFLKGLDIILSNSMQEGYHVAIFEAMASGAYPLIHKWLGAETLFPQECLFLTQREMVDKILIWERWPQEQKLAKALQIQKWVRKEHDAKKHAKKVVDVILNE